ncbi:xanthine dehydrogenase accessory protein XdhC [Deinococcus sonorensis]|uniref:Xanthine dehydrogenase accessory protein XdhC n=2 Tax=Deinococcus sonorensis TaxID=309891 RepID=A0AAU7UD35_9DEIO
MQWLTELQRLQAAGTPCVLVTLTGVRGHAPREAGAKMIVTAKETFGTVGGGNLEMTAVQRARALLAVQAGTPDTLTLRLTPTAPAEHGRQCCGGEVTLLLEPLLARRPVVALFGVGHVGLALARILSTLELELHLCDGRAEQLSPERLADVLHGAATVRVHHAPIPDSVLGELPAGAHVLILTHDHAEDAALCDAALRRPELGFIGLIGSAGKWRHFQQQLAAEGHSPATIRRITCPIGLPGIGSKQPAAIAVSVAAQLLQHIEVAQRPQNGPLND